MAVVTITTAGAGTWTAPVGVSAVIVECWGGGGAGGQRTINNSGAGGGGGGSYARLDALAVTGGVVYNYTVGLGGTDGTTPVNGGTTTFTGDGGGFCAAPGAVSVTANSQIATIGAVAINGDHVTTGGAGANGTSTLSGGGGESGSPNFSGFNGANSLGGTGRVDAGDGGNGRTTSGDGFPGIQPGGGGGGGYRTTGANRNGGPGGAGQIRLTFTVYVFPALGGTYGITGAIQHYQHVVPTSIAFYSLTGGDVTFPPSGSTAKSIPVSPEVYNLTGVAITFKHDVPTLGTPYLLTGDPTVFIVGRRTSDQTGTSYALTGTDVTYRVTGKLLPDPGAYTLFDPNTVILTKSGLTAKSMPAAAEVYSISGTTPPLSYGIPVFTGPAMVYGLIGPEIFFNVQTVAPGPRIDALPAFYIYDYFPATLASMVPGTPGVYTLTGSIAILRKGFSLVGGPVSGVYSYTGQDQILRRTFPLVAAAGVYAVTDSGLVEFDFNGVTTTFMDVLGDTYTTTGADIALRLTRKVLPDEGDYDLTGFDITFGVLQNQAFIFPLDSGVYDLTGSIAGTIYTPTIGYGLAGGAESGIYTLTGSDTIPKRAVLPMPAVGGSYAITGTAITFPTSAARKLVADVGSYFINGTAMNGRRRPKPGGGFDYILGVSSKDSIIPQRRRRR